MKILLLLIIPAVLWWMRRQQQPSVSSNPSDPLDTEVMRWTPDDKLTLRHLVKSLCIIGAAGSGKTSSVGRLLAYAIARINTSLLVLASKPEDREFWQDIADKAGRELIVVAPDQPHRFNFIQYEASQGADAREITEAIMTISEVVMREGGKGNDSPFWDKEPKRMIRLATELLMRACGTVDTWSLQKFITDAPQTPEQVCDPAWQQGFHYQTVLKADKNCGTKLQQDDFDVAAEYWHKEYPAMNTETRTSILAHVMGALHEFNTGLVREMIGGRTTISPELFEQGAMVLVDFPKPNYGAAGQFIAGSLKYATERHILRRKASGEAPVIVIWCDEYQNHVTAYDSTFLAECRSHKGCMVCLTQSIHSFYSSIGGKEAHSTTKSLMTNYGHKIFMALGDEESAKYASSLVGQGFIRTISTNRNVRQRIYEQFANDFSVSTGMSEQVGYLILPRLFMNGMKTGGPENGLICEGWVIRNGESFSTGENAIFCGFPQY